MRAVRLATRASDLALAQARAVARAIEARLSVATEILPIKTTGDRLAGSLAEAGGKGLFVKEIEEALLSGRADVAVHSAKDLPAALPSELELVAFPERADARDALVSRRRGQGLAALPRGGRVGTGSLRRAAQLLARRPDLAVVPLRGNVPTRLAKLEAEELDAVVLACAGLDRLGLGARIAERIPPEWLLPAVGQGALALEARRGDPIGRVVAELDHAPTATCVIAERAFLARIGGDCNAPLAAYARWRGRVEVVLELNGLLSYPTGRRVLRASARGAGRAARALGSGAAEEILGRGGRALLAELSGVGA
jgi:hydroxymethylbilane synthase